MRFAPLSEGHRRALESLLRLTMLWRDGQDAVRAAIAQDDALRAYRAYARWLKLRPDTDAWRFLADNIECNPVAAADALRDAANRIDALGEPLPREPATEQWYWLIERGPQENHFPTLWLVNEARYEWSSDAAMAMRFPSKDAAEAFISGKLARYPGDPNVRCHAALAVAAAMQRTP